MQCLKGVMRKDRQEKNENIITIQIEKRRKVELSYEGMKIDSRGVKG